MPPLLEESLIGSKQLLTLCPLLLTLHFKLYLLWYESVVPVNQSLVGSALSVAFLGADLGCIFVLLALCTKGIHSFLVPFFVLLPVPLHLLELTLHSVDLCSVVMVAVKAGLAESITFLNVHLDGLSKERGLLIQI